MHVSDLRPDYSARAGIEPRTMHMQSSKANVHRVKPQRQGIVGKGWHTVFSERCDFVTLGSDFQKMLHRELRPYCTLCYSFKSIVIVLTEEKWVQISVLVTT